MAAQKQKHDLDLTIFESIRTECFGKDGNVVISDCDHLMRLIHGLKYYEKFDSSNHPEKQGIFGEFIASV